MKTIQTSKGSIPLDEIIEALITQLKEPELRWFLDQLSAIIEQRKFEENQTSSPE